MAEIAEMLGVTRARVTQILDMTLIAPDIQELMLGDARRTAWSARDLRRMTRTTAWSAQRAAPRLDHSQRRPTTSRTASTNA